MKWSGETEKQRLAREFEWHKRFAWFPLQMSDGTWVWLENVERKKNRWAVYVTWQYREIGSDWEPLWWSRRPPPSHLRQKKVTD